MLLFRLRSLDMWFYMCIYIYACTYTSYAHIYTCICVVTPRWSSGYCDFFLILQHNGFTASMKTMEDERDMCVLEVNLWALHLAFDNPHSISCVFLYSLFHAPPC